MRPYTRENGEFKEVYNDTPKLTNGISGSGRQREYWGNRKLALELVNQLKKLGVNKDNIKIISSRGKDAEAIDNFTLKVNSEYRAANKNCILVSLHSNALSDDKWDDANYWSIYCQSNEYVEERKEFIDESINPHRWGSYELAKAIAEVANEELKKTEVVKEIGNITVYKEPKVFKSSYAGIRPITFANPPTVLSENLFHTNRMGVKFLGSKKGQEILATIHAKGIVNFLDKAGNVNNSANK